MSKPNLTPEQVEQMWRQFLTTGEPPDFERHYGMKFQDYRRIMARLPSDPRCQLCDTPFNGIGGRLAQHLWGLERSRLNPTFCNECERFANSYHGGAEVELSMLFADVRGSTTLAEGMSALSFSQLINRFYQVATDELVRARALIEKLIGDEVTGLFVPGITGPQHARVALDTAQAILRATGHADPQGPWIPVGVGVHTGTAFVGAVGSPQGVTDITALGDAVNTAARLASQARAGEVLVSERTCEAAALDDAGLEVRHLNLKGRSEPVDVRVVRVGPQPTQQHV